MLLIGSRALAYWDKTFTPREDADYDLVMDTSSTRDNKVLTSIKEQDIRVEVHPTSSLNNKELLYRFFSNHLGSVGGKYTGVCSLRGLAAIKRSHLYRDYNFDKHITQYHRHLAKHLHEEDLDFVKERTRLTKEKYRQGNPSLRQTNEDFFDDAVDKKYDHDWLHEVVAYYDRPLFEKLKNDQSSAWCEKDLWDSLKQEDKLKCVCEEVYVISTERFMVPSDWSFPSKLAYMKALRKVCTTLTSGWFRDFAIDNYPAIVEMYSLDKFKNIKERLDAEG